jgi:cell division septation protein DedD
MKKKGLKARPPARKTAREYTPPKERGVKGPVFRWGFLLFVAVWMFVLGIIVGRYATPVDFDPRRIEKELAELRAAEIQKEKERLKAEAKALYDMELDFYVALPSPAKAPSSPAVDDPPTAPPETKRPLSTKPSTPAGSESRIVPPAPRAPAPPKPPAPDAAEARYAPGRYAIQVASFVVASDADRTVALLKRRGYAAAYRTEDHVPGYGLRYRVRIGPFRDTRAAGGVLAQLKEMDRFRDAFILKNRHP